MRRTLLFAAALLAPLPAHGQTPATVFVVKDRAGQVASVHTRRDGPGSASAAIQAYETSPRRRDAGPYRVVAAPLDAPRATEDSWGEPLPLRGTVGWTLTGNRPQRFVLEVDAAGPVLVTAERALDVPEDATRPRLAVPSPSVAAGRLAIVAQGPNLPANGLDSGAVPRPGVRFVAAPGTYHVWVWSDTTAPVVVRALTGGAAR